MDEIIDAIWERKAAQGNITASGERVMLTRDEVAYLLANSAESGHWPSHERPALEKTTCEHEMWPGGLTCGLGVGHDGPHQPRESSNVTWTYTACWADTGGGNRCLLPTGHGEHRA